MLQKYLKLEKANVASPCYRKYHLSLVKTFHCFDLSGLHISIEYSGSNQHFEVSETLTSFRKSRCLNFSEYSFWEKIYLQRSLTIFRHIFLLDLNKNFPKIFNLENYGACHNTSIDIATILFLITINNFIIKLYKTSLCQR